MPYNLLTQKNKVLYICQACNKGLSPKAAYSGCTCGNHIFRVAARGDIPRAFDPDRKFEDPYQRQKRSPIKPGDPGGYKLTHPGDDTWSGGLGTKEREGYPKGFSQQENREHETSDVRQKLPSEPNMIDDFGNPEYRVQEWFVDPSDATSIQSRTERDMKGWDMGVGYSGDKGGSLDARLRSNRLNKSISRKNDDNNSIFDTVRKRQRGVNRKE